MIFDEVFSEQVFQTGKIEDGRVVRGFFKRTGQALKQGWLIDMVKGLIRHLPVSLLARMGLASIVAPRTRGWSGARDAIEEYVNEQELLRQEALGLDKRDQAAANHAGGQV